MFINPMPNAVMFWFYAMIAQNPLSFSGWYRAIGAGLSIMPLLKNGLWRKYLTVQYVL
jgi:hypothetical protein